MEQKIIDKIRNDKMEQTLFIKYLVLEQHQLIMTNKEFAKYLGISCPTLYSIYDNYPIFAKTAKRICDKLKITDKKVIASINVKYYS